MHSNRRIPLPLRQLGHLPAHYQILSASLQPTVGPLNSPVELEYWVPEETEVPEFPDLERIPQLLPGP